MRTNLSVDHISHEQRTEGNGHVVDDVIVKQPSLTTPNVGQLRRPHNPGEVGGGEDVRSGAGGAGGGGESGRG